MSFLKIGRLISRGLRSRKTGGRIVKEVKKHFEDPANVAILAGEIAVGVAAEAAIDKVLEDEKVGMKQKTKKKVPKA